MKIKNLSLTNFRNYESLSLRPNPYMNIFYGKNASGKTNILESISMLISGGSFRTYKDKEILLFGKDYFRVGALISQEGLDKDYDLYYDLDRKKNLKVNLSKVQSLRDLRSKAPLVVFTPEDLDIIKGGPDLKRKLFDQILGLCDIIYRLNLQKFKSVLKEKNDQLKIRRHKLDKNILFESYNIQLASLGSYLIHRRRSFVEEFVQVLEQIHTYISGGEKISIKYQNPHLGLANIKDIEKALLEEYRRSLANDLYRRSSTTGPQRDNYIIYLDDLDARHFGSQGQQRNAILSIKLAQMQMIQKYKNTQPILLLDDVFSELDQERRSRLIDYVKNSQVFITMAEKKYLDEFAGFQANIYKLADNKVKLINGGNNVRRSK